MRFSVLIPVYNAEKYIERCVNSLVKQSRNDVEIIIVDDGSTDNSPAIIDELSQNDSRLIVIHKENGGVTSARKKGCNIANGDYIVCVDADDWVSDTLFSELDKAIEQYNTPDVICYDYFEASNTTTKPVRMGYRAGFFNYAQLIEEIFPSLLWGKDGKVFPNSLWGKAVKRDLFKKYQNSLDNKIVIAEDMACIKACIASATNMCIIHKPLYYYWYNENSITKGKNSFSVDTPELIALYLKNNINISKFDFEEQLCRWVTRFLYEVLSSQFNSEMRYFKVRQLIVSEIDKHAEWINRSQYSNKRDQFSRIILKNKIILFMKVYCKLRL